ncbi:MAG TPA: hypothetical protein VIS96_09245 [Terrimicrobiaceae bacterium]
MPAPLRNPDINTAPSHAGAGPNSYTQYKLRNAADQDTARADVLRVAGNGSFVSKCLLMITRHGSSKQFVTITGQDGLTWGIKDFISDSVHPFFAKLDAALPGVIDSVFAEHADKLRSSQWLNKRIDKRNDRGLVTIGWLRRGLDEILCDRRFHGLQLHQFIGEAVVPSRKIFDEAGFRLAFSLAAMVGVANSFGATGMAGRLRAARQEVGPSGGEREIIQSFCSAYARRDDGGHEGSTERLIKRGFELESGPLPDVDTLGHSGRRIRALFLLFPWADRESFNEPGDFALEADEKFPEPA